MSEILLVYIVCINLIAFVIMFIDKQRAIRNKWRIPERTLFALAFIGGALGAILGMHLFHHKTKHVSFRILMPCFLILNLIFIFLLLSGDLF